MRSIWWTAQLEVRLEIFFLYFDITILFYLDLEFMMVEAKKKEEDEDETPAGDDDD